LRLQLPFCGFGRPSQKTPDTLPKGPQKNLFLIFDDIHESLRTQSRRSRDRGFPVSSSAGCILFRAHLSPLSLRLINALPKSGTRERVRCTWLRIAAHRSRVLRGGFFRKIDAACGGLKLVKSAARRNLPQSFDGKPFFTADRIEIRRLASLHFFLLKQHRRLMAAPGAMYGPAADRK
jgi:hypothetical protein